MSKISTEDITPKPKETIRLILDLTVEEAQAILAVTDNIGGHPEKSPRKLFDEIRRVLVNFVSPPQKSLLEPGIPRGIYFKDSD